MVRTEGVDVEALRRLKRAGGERSVYRSTAPTLRDVFTIQSMAPLAKHYVPWSSSAIRPSGLQHVVNEAVVNDYKVIVEPRRRSTNPLCLASSCIVKVGTCVLLSTPSLGVPASAAGVGIGSWRIVSA